LRCCEGEFEQVGAECPAGCAIGRGSWRDLAPLWNDFWANTGPALGAPLIALLGIFILVGIAAFGLAVLHYFRALGAAAEPGYNALRQRIARDYARRLEVFLDAIDRFFGDAGMADRTLFPRAFGLRKPAPLWTAPAFDRCLLLAFVYLIAAIVVIWAVSNHVGPAEAALGLHATDGWRRAADLVAIATLAFAVCRVVQAKGSRRLAWLIVVFAVAAGVVVVVAGAGVGDVVVALTFAGVFAVALPVAFVVAAAVAIAFAVAVAFAGAATGAGAGAFAVTVVGANVVLFMEGNSKVPGWQRTVPPVILIIMLLACFADVALLSHLDHWQMFGPQLLFLGPVTLITALFGWLSLGFTRALMRRGLEGEKWWPYLYAFIDALLALVVMAFFLAVVMIVVVQLFDDIAVHGGGTPVFPPMRDFLDAIKADPGNQDYWWIYAILFSTMLPSLMNLFIVGVSLARGMSGVSSWLMSKVREGEAVPAYDRVLVAIALALQGVAGLAIAVLAQGFLLWVIIWQGMPRLGFGVLDLAHFLAH
jgi:hypothetical protein